MHPNSHAGGYNQTAKTPKIKYLKKEYIYMKTKRKAPNTSKGLGEFS
jgi:hypothetical protein